MTDEYWRNEEIRNLLSLWEWCSRTLHVKWQRGRKYRNTCLIGLLAAINENRVGTELTVWELPQVYPSLPSPLFDEEGLLAYWQALPTSAWEMALGCFTQGSPLAEPLNRLRSVRQSNVVLDQLYKIMTSREKRYGSEWPTEGHHPENEYVQLRKEMTPLWNEVEKLLAQECSVMETLAREVLAQGPWQWGSLPASAWVRKTPESLLSRAVRLKLWQVARDIRGQGLDEREELEALCQGLSRAITHSVKAAILSQGYTADQVVDDFLNFDMHKLREEIVGKQDL